ncbi:MAG: superoxide dismutase, Ni [Candidatus Parcubacteria bacterium]|nr:superoxide dismutase, Ni [Candidatus Parcubacteria bacterium]
MIIRKFVLAISRFLPITIAYAHCDIPCGIYDPHAVQVGAHTVIRMTQLLSELKREDETKAEHDIARMTYAKEDHGSLIEEELGTLENDYFKEEHFKAHPELKELITSAVKLSVKTRQTIDMESAEKLLEEVLKISEIFYKTKNLIPVRVRSPYPTEREIVFYK